ncbi:hypothetical protein KMW28_17460 [Flammeovirga yaeyamensis]|uniref:Limiting CO2-inducible protein B/C beta carbonyic anhydrase domain-containing protein n=1 Tax=Flammeovirga yaeyamensis TaxID=367791 RepID=A0AAX1N5V5_9BACT|nr:hypothetical protein [Flammeovirga yaeyamensis]MBB3698192.1 hypothetical protein [Flammeovirga yaeyamensis]NMF34453.1 hypothetical protein [Flammeovirga yaeyamensis]QWG01432.1 hypothetical protein KMW28_17460 [Flammeovirga yaeyamensis]
MKQRLYDEIVQKHFPNAKDAKDTSIHYLGKMQLEHHLDISKVLMATSVCSDDINVPSTTFFNVLFGPFNMGGLGGIPFVGKTGMTAFAHHVPDGGSAFIFYGPHIGITLEGETGKMYRPRMEEKGNSCGALMLALNRLQDENYKPVRADDDIQQMLLEENLLPYRERILESSDQAKAITEVTYEIIDKQIHEYIKACKSEFHVDKITLLGGIVINTELGTDDYFVAKNFEVIDLNNIA